MKMWLALAFMVPFSCKQASQRDIAFEYFKRIHLNPLVKECYGVSIQSRGDQHYYTIHGKRGIRKSVSGFDYFNNVKLSLKEINQINTLINFTKQEKIIGINGNFNNREKIEFKIDENIFLIKNDNLIDIDSLLSQGVNIKQIEDDWYYYGK